MGKAVESPMGAKMRALADSGHPRASELRAKADEFEATMAVSDEKWDARKMLGAWARARRLWCDCTGEPLV